MFMGAQVLARNQQNEDVKILTPHKTNSVCSQA